MPVQERRKTSIPSAVLATLIGFAISPSQASIITNGCANTNVSCTLMELAGDENQNIPGGSIIIGDKLFHNWFIDDFSTIPPDTANIEVIPLDDQPLNPGVQFNANGELGGTGFSLIDMDIGFSVSTLDGSARIKDNSLEINEFTFAAGNTGGLIQIFEDVSDAAGNLIGEKFVTADNADPEFFSLLDSATFAPQATISVVKTILVGGDSDTDNVSLDSFTQRFSQIPEPVTISLIALGLAGLGLTRKRRT